MYKWQLQVVEREKAYTNEELYDEVLSQSQGDDWDGYFTRQGQWEFDYLERKLRERLATWFLADCPGTPDTQ